MPEKRASEHRQDHQGEGSEANLSTHAAQGIVHFAGWGPPERFARNWQLDTWRQQDYVHSLPK